MTAQIHDIIVWRGHDYQLVGVDGLMVAAGAGKATLEAAGLSEDDAHSSSS
jgi:hypothetical protein